MFQLTSVCPSLLWGWAVNKRSGELLRCAQPLRPVAEEVGAAWESTLSRSALLKWCSLRRNLFYSSINRGTDVFHSTQIYFTHCKTLAHFLSCQGNNWNWNWNHWIQECPVKKCYFSLWIHGFWNPLLIKNGKLSKCHKPMKTALWPEGLWPTSWETLLLLTDSVTQTTPNQSVLLWSQWWTVWGLWRASFHDIPKTKNLSFTFLVTTGKIASFFFLRMPCPCWLIMNVVPTF